MTEVLYLRAELKYVTVRTGAREYIVEESLTHLEEEFGDRLRANPPELPGASNRHSRVREERRRKRVRLGRGGARRPASAFRSAAANNMS